MIDCLYSCFKHWSENCAIWIYSDPHFNDKDLPLVFNRPNAEEQIKYINSKCGKKDTLIMLGDIGDIECVKKLRAKRKILICGNHDVGHTKYEEVFDEVYSGPLVIAEKLILSHEPINVDWAFNIHGHNHNWKSNDIYHYNVCSDANNYELLNLNQLIKSGALSKIKSIHRDTIDNATERKRKRIGER